MKRYRTAKPIPCCFCGKTKMLSPSKIRYTRRFCDESCHGKYVTKFGLQKREKNYAWNGGKHIDAKGYVRIRMPEHPQALAQGYIREHRHIASIKLGRPLKKNEDVHHIDGNKQNNHPSNFQVIGHGEHSSHHNKGRKR